MPEPVEKTTCSVCLDPIEASNLVGKLVGRTCTYTTQCGHSFHTRCIQEYANHKLPNKSGKYRDQLPCPYCRGEQDTYEHAGYTAYHYLPETMKNELQSFGLSETVLEKCTQVYNTWHGCEFTKEEFVKGIPIKNFTIKDCLNHFHHHFSKQLAEKGHISLEFPEGTCTFKKKFLFPKSNSSFAKRIESKVDEYVKRKVRLYRAVAIQNPEIFQDIERSMVSLLCKEELLRFDTYPDELEAEMYVNFSNIEMPIYEPPPPEPTYWESLFRGLNHLIFNS